MMFNTMLKF